MRRLIVGDIHGCYAEFMQLLDAAALSPEDEVIALGDIVDRGPATQDVLQFFRTQPWARSIQGNHERKHFRSFRGELQPARSQKITRSELGPAYPDAVMFMESLPVWIELPEAVLVHGFWEPGKALSGQPVNVIVGTLGGEHYLEQHYGRPWFELYDGPQPLIVGHRDYLGNGQPLVFQERVFGLDTGCVRGGRLTGLILPEFRLVSVPSRGDHWTETQARYHLSHPPPPPPPPWDAAANVLLAKLYAVIVRQHEQTLAELRPTLSYDTLPASEQAKAYADQIGQTPLARYLHRLRQGRLSLDEFRDDVGHPGRLHELARRCGHGAD